MDRGHSCTPSYPLADQMHYWHPHHLPHYIPPQPHQPWNSTLGYSSPMICQSCGNSSFSMPNYFWRPPYSYNYPHNFTMPPQYMPPQSYQPWYDFQGNAPRENNHCCGCPNHMCSKEVGNVKIEEEGQPVRDSKKDYSLIPYPFQNWPFPLVWNSPRDYYIKGEERGVPEKLGVNDLRRLGSSNLKNGSGESNQRLHQDDGSDARLPFPIIWMPHQPEEKKKSKEKNIDQQIGDAEPEAGMGNTKDACLQKDIIVNEGVERRKENESCPVKNVDADGENDVNNGNKAKKQSISKSKSPSKLPPVCLRVDPLPKRKSDYGSKKGVDQKPSGANTSSGNSSPDKVVKSDVAAKSEVSKTKGTTKSIQVIDGSTRDGGEITVDKSTAKQHDEVLKEAKIPRDYSESLEGARRSQSEDPESERVENNAERIQHGVVTKEEEISNKSKRELTKEEAAVVIQSAYRGFEVRRWEPLKKLKQIAKVRGEMAGVRNLIQEMEQSSDVRDNKRRTIISEIIMSLLLKLDTIQGLPPSLRDVRKSMVRELVTLQELLDSLVNEGDVVTPPQEGSSPEPPRNHVDGESHSNNNSEVSDNDLVGELSSKDLGTVGQETFGGTELPSEDTMGKEDKDCQLGEEERDVASVFAMHEDREALTSDLYADRADQVKISEAFGLKMSADDAHGNEVDEERVADHLVSDNKVNDDLMPGNIENLGHDGEETLKEKSSTFKDVELPCEAITGKDEEVRLTGEEERDASSGFANKEDHEVLTSDISSDQGKELDKVKIDETSGLETSADAHGYDFDEERVEVHQVSDNMSKDESTPENMTAYNPGPSEGVDMHSFVEGKEQSFGEKSEDSSMPERTTNESPIENKFGDSDSPRISHEITTSEDVFEDLRNDAEACLAQKEEEGNEISDDESENVRNDSEACLAQKEEEGYIPYEVREEKEEDAESRSISSGVPSEVCEEEKSIIPSQVCEEEEEEEEVERNQSNSFIEEEKSFEVNMDARPANTSETRKEDERGEKKALDSDGGRRSSDQNWKLFEENEKLREMMEKLIKSGQEQLNTISDLSSRINDLEKKLSRKKKKKRAVKMTRYHNVV